LVTSERSGYVRIQINILISLGDLLTDLSDYAGAYSFYDNALTLATNLGHSLYIFYASLGQARLQRLNGNHTLAVEELRRTELSQVDLGIYEKAILTLELGCCWLDANKLELGIDTLREALTLLAVARLWLEVALSVRDPAGAADRIKALLPARRDWGKPIPQIIHAGQAVHWLRKRGSLLLKEPVLELFFEQAERVHESLPVLCRKLRNINEKPQPATPRLEIISFGNIVVRHKQRVVELSDWQTREARDLFLFLLQSPPLTKEQIALVFWPDISPARLKVRFKINIYRIRQALGQDAIVFEDDRYRFNRTINYTWDREEFDKLFEKLRQSTLRSEKRMLLEQAVVFLKGDYLADVDANWVVLDRLKYQEFYRYAMLELAADYLQDGQAHDCLNTARRVLLSDPLLESAHRLIIQAYASLHDPANMTLQYRQYRQTLESELGLEPSLEISTLYQQLMAAI
jgi:two-component SAPR family response regulator